MAKKNMSKEEIQQAVAVIVNAGENRNLETVDFEDANRPLTCIEVDFPILKVNAVAGLEAKSGAATKPIYQEMKWWARRQSSVFRTLLLSAAIKAPEDPAEAAKLVWENYYCNHQSNEAFSKLKVADIFMGGGTTVVEGSRLGMNMFGKDLNPIAWLVVKNELAKVSENEIKDLFKYIEDEVKPQIAPFYECSGPNNEKGIWYKVKTNEKMDETFNPLSVSAIERKNYRYEGPELIYTFWAKHGPCTSHDCKHRTPLFSSSIIAEKQFSIKAWSEQVCDKCGCVFDVELNEVRMAPDEQFVFSQEEVPFTVLNERGLFNCPKCGTTIMNKLDKAKSKNKKVVHKLLIHPDWMKGAKGKDSIGLLGGTATSSQDATRRWLELRQENLKFIEIRGNIPEEIYLENSNVLVNLYEGTMPKRSTFTCQEETCGKEHDVLDAIKASGTTGPVAPYALQCYSPKRNKTNAAYSGRYFKKVDKLDVDRLNHAFSEWEHRKHNDLKGYWPESELPYGFMTHHLQGGVPNHGFTHWYTMFNSRQLLVHALILKTIDEAPGFSESSKLVALGAFQQYLRSNSGFTFYHKKNDQAAKHFSNNNYHPRSTTLEVPVFSKVGDGSFYSALNAILEGERWKKEPWDLVPKSLISDAEVEISEGFTGLSVKQKIGDSPRNNAIIECGSSTNIDEIATASYDLVITDPPFGGLLHYSELSDYFYVWLRLVLKKWYPSIFNAEFTPKTLEAVANKARNPENPEDFYKKILTECWRETHRILKPGGILAFTFHHSEDEPWVDVLESLFNSGFYLEATYPIRSDETKGEGEFGSKTIEYDIIHVCRKRIEAGTEISWPKLRRQILRDVRQLQDLLEHHQKAGLPDADIEVIKRGKALEYFSRHYGKVYVEVGREFTVKEALAGINEIIQEQADSEGIKAPDNAEPLTRQFLRIFAKKEIVERDQMQKFLRGSGIAPSDFIARNWCCETNKPKGYLWYNALEFAKNKKSIGNLRRDFEQALFLIGACFDGSGINVKKELNLSEFRPHPALGDLLVWLSNNGPSAEFRNATITARHLYQKWSADHQPILLKQMSLFDLMEEHK